MYLVFTWIQGCWKWTHWRILVEKYGFTLLEMWQELRKIASSWSEVGNKLKEILESGALVNPQIVWEVMKEILKNQTNDKLILDWFVRNEWNKKTIEEIIPDYKVVFFELSKEKALNRLLWRVYDTETWETFPSWTVVNPKNWNKLIKRSDDNEAWILKRIDEFVTKTLPIVKIQEQEWRVIKINSDQSIEDVSKEVISKLGL
jgi:adenylate kinase